MASNVPQAVQSCHELLLWLVPQLDKLPRARRFMLGERIEAGLIEVLELLVEASYTHNKESPLRRANLRLEVARHLWRVGFELRNVATRQYEHGAKLMNDLGRQIGGWLRSRVGDVLGVLCAIEWVTFGRKDGSDGLYPPFENL
jgi:hypothetical protein